MRSNLKTDTPRSDNLEIFCIDTVLVMSLRRWHCRYSISERETAFSILLVVITYVLCCEVYILERVCTRGASPKTTRNTAEQ